MLTHVSMDIENQLADIIYNYTLRTGKQVIDKSIKYKVLDVDAVINRLYTYANIIVNESESNYIIELV